MHRVGFGWLASVVVLCGCSARDGASSADAGVAGLKSAPSSLDPEGARVLRRKLRSERPPAIAPFVTGKRTELPFAASHDEPKTFAPAFAQAPAVIAVPAVEASPSGRPSTFFLPSLIAPMPDHSGRYAMRSRDWSTFLTPQGFAFALSSKAAPKGWGLHCTLVGAREGALVAEDARQSHVHHYAGAPSKWATDLPTFGRVAWEEIVPGVDMVAEPARGGMAYRFVLSPSAKVSDLVMRWAGANAVRAVEGGRGLDVETDLGVLRVRGLRAFAVEGEQRIELPARHVVHGNDVALEVDGWNGRTPLVIDPTIAWSSYLGGGANDSGTGIAVDGSGNALITGYTESADFPTTGGFDKTLGGTRDAFVTKVSPAGALLWSSYFGGTANDFGYGIAVDGSGNALVTGLTQSADFPTTGGFDTTYGADLNGDAFVTKVSGAGALVWSSYLGGNGYDLGLGIAVDGSGNALITGSTTSTDFPTTGGFDTTIGGPTWATDGFVTKVSASGAVVWSSYLGGAKDDVGNGIAVDGSGNIFITGGTSSTDFPSTGGFDTTLDGYQDAFVTKVSASGTVVWSSYFGGTVGDLGARIAVDGSGNAFIMGDTESTDFPTTGGFDTTHGGTWDTFVTKVSGAGTMLWSSYLGGSYVDHAQGIAVDASGNAFVTGYTQSSDFPTTGGFDTTLGGTSSANDDFVAKVSGAGALLWSSYLGGASDDIGSSIAVDGSGNAFVTGYTQSTDFPATGGFDTTLGGTQDAFVTKLAFAALGTTCAVASECRSSLCVDGVCCDKPCAGSCEACSATKKGTAAGTDGTCAAIADGRDPDKECTAQSCASGVVTKAQVCNGLGACRGDGTIACGVYPCSGVACATTCGVDGDCVPSAFCSGGTCNADLDVGAACVRASQCKSGFCADGVCCDKACTGACEACSAAHKGSGTDGTCGNVLADTDPKSACPVGTGTCAADGLCDGAGNCRPFAKPGAACGATTCTAGAVSGMVCAGDSATCSATAGVACAPYACGASACKTSCSADADCDATAYCTSTSVCAPKLDRGMACKEARECGSGFCVDGVCCNSLCAGQCEACAESGAAGTCTAVLRDPRGMRPACDALPASDCAKTTCDGVVHDKCAGYANGTTTACGADACTADKKYQKAGACDGHGKCALPAPQNCTPFVCDLTSTTGCKTSCETDADCTEGFTCADHLCIQGAKCNADRTASIDKTGNETPCAPYLCGTDGKCLSTCTGSEQCAPGSVCDTASKTCVVTGSANDDSGCGCETGPRPGRWSLAALAFAFAAVARRRRRVQAAAS